MVFGDAKKVVEKMVKAVEQSTSRALRPPTWVPLAGRARGILAVGALVREPGTLFHPSER